MDFRKDAGHARNTTQNSGMPKVLERLPDGYANDVKWMRTELSKITKGIKESLGYAIKQAGTCDLAEAEVFNTVSSAFHMDLVVPFGDHGYKLDIVPLGAKLRSSDTVELARSSTPEQPKLQTVRHLVMVHEYNISLAVRTANGPVIYRFILRVGIKPGSGVVKCWASPTADITICGQIPNGSLKPDGYLPGYKWGR